MEMSLKNIIEAALMASGKPLNIKVLRSLFEEGAEPERQEIVEVLRQLQSESEGHGYEVIEVASGWRMQVRQDLSTWINRLWEEKPARYSRALLETMSLIAYRQPITRGEIEEIRGVAVSTNIMKTLQEREWIRLLGHKDVPGRPAMYGTTKKFLDYFGLRTLEELPTLMELKELGAMNGEFELEQEEPELDDDGDDSSRAELRLVVNESST